MSLKKLMRMRSPSYLARVQSIAPANLIAYWSMLESSGTTADNAEGTAARDGTYARNVTTMTTAAGPAGGTAPVFTPGSSDQVDIYSASLSTALAFDEFTIAAWVAVDAWDTGTNDYVISIHDDANNWIRMVQATTTNRLSYTVLTGGTTIQVVSTPSRTADIWYHTAFTGSLSGDAMKAYEDGAQVGTTQTGLVAFNGDGLTSTAVSIGSHSSGSFWGGKIAHVAIWDTPLTAPQIAALATV